MYRCNGGDYAPYETIKSIYLVLLGHGSYKAEQIKNIVEKAELLEDIFQKEVYSV